MANPVRPWLKRFLALEIKEAALYKKEIDLDPEARLLPEYERFYDDGSTLKSIIVSADSAEPEAFVQVREVLSIRPLRMILSDGEHAIKALVDSKAVVPYEEDVGKQITHDRQGDILQLDWYTVITTAHGPNEDHVTLRIKGLRFVHNQPKLFGSPTLLCDVDLVRTQLDRIEQSRQKSIASRSAKIVHDSPTTASPLPASNERVATPPPPAPQPIAPPSQPMATQMVSQMQTQLPEPRRRQEKKSLLDLDKDGLEIQSGVNLDPPRAGGYPKTTKSGNAALLNLINSRPRHERITTVKQTNHIEVDADSPQYHGNLAKPSSMKQEPPDDSVVSGPPPIQVPSTNNHTSQTLRQSIDQGQQATPAQSQLPARTVSTEDVPSNSHGRQQTPAEAQAAGRTANSERAQSSEDVDMRDAQPGEDGTRRFYMIDADQEELLMQKDSWPALTRTWQPSSKVPAKLFAAWADAAADQPRNETRGLVPQVDLSQRAAYWPAQGTSARPADKNYDDLVALWAAAPSQQQRVVKETVESSAKDSDESTSDTGANDEHRQQTPSDMSGDSDSEIPWSDTKSPEEREVLPPESSQLPAAITPSKLPSRNIDKQATRSPPVDKYRGARREYLSVEQRKKWLREVYGGPGASGFSPQDACQRYMARYSNDTVTPEDMKALYASEIGSFSKRRRTVDADLEISEQLGVQRQERDHSNSKSSPLRRRSQPLEAPATSGLAPSASQSIQDMTTTSGNSRSHTSQAQRTGSSGTANLTQRSSDREPSQEGEVLIKHSGEQDQEADEELYETSQTPARIPATVLKAQQSPTTAAKQDIAASPSIARQDVSTVGEEPKRFRPNKSFAEAWLGLPRRPPNGKQPQQFDRNAHALSWDLP